jgi:hypothetical protein
VNSEGQYVEKLTDGPVGVGTRYRARWANPPPSRSSSSIAPELGDQRQSTGHEHPVPRAPSPTPPRGRYGAYLELHPRGLAWLVAPLALLAMRRPDQQNMRRIRDALESTTVASTK